MRREQLWDGFLVLCAALAGSGAATAPGNIVLVCRLQQTGGGAPVNFVRRLDIDPAAHTVAIADDLGDGFRPLGIGGILMKSDKTGIVFDFVDSASIGRSAIDWKTGSYRFADGLVVTRGSCSPAPP